MRDDEYQRLHKMDEVLQRQWKRFEREEREEGDEEVADGSDEDEPTDASWGWCLKVFCYFVVGWAVARHFGPLDGIAAVSALLLVTDR